MSPSTVQVMPTLSENRSLGSEEGRASEMDHNVFSMTHHFILPPVLNGIFFPPIPPPVDHSSSKLPCQCLHQDTAEKEASPLIYMQRQECKYEIVIFNILGLE